MAQSRTYRAWASMKQRCNNPSYIGYRNYGGRGITYEDRWHFYEYFVADMGECPDTWVLDRIDNEAGYSKENCRWTTRTENNRNSRKALLSVRKVQLIHALLRSLRPGVSAWTAYRLLGKLFGVKASTIDNVVEGRRWKGVV